MRGGERGKGGLTAGGVLREPRSSEEEAGVGELADGRGSRARRAMRMAQSGKGHGSILVRCGGPMMV